LAELIQGAKSDTERDVLRDFVHVFDFLPDTVDQWRQAGELSRALRKKGKSTGLADCYIAVTAAVGNVKLLTLGKHFEVIKGAAGLRLFELDLPVLKNVEPAPSRAGGTVWRAAEMPGTATRSGCAEPARRVSACCCQMVLTAWSPMTMIWS
jgi:hypothetical protein